MNPNTQFFNCLLWDSTRVKHHVILIRILFGSRYPLNQERPMITKKILGDVPDKSLSNLDQTIKWGITQPFLIILAPLESSLMEQGCRRSCPHKSDPAFRGAFYISGRPDPAWNQAAYLRVRRESRVLALGLPRSGVNQG